MPDTPEISQQSKENMQFTLAMNNWLGLAPASQTRVNLKVGEAFHIAQALAVDTVQNIGVLTPGRAAGVDYGALTGNLKRIIHQKYSSGNSIQGYCIEAANKVHLFNEVGSGVDGLGSWPATLSGTGTHAAHTTFVGEDLIAYKIGSNTRLFASYNDNTDGDVALIYLDASTVTNNFMSNSATGGATLGLFPHPMLVGENGFLYIADGTSIHKYDGQTGANGTFYPAVIDLPTGWIIYDMVDSLGFCWILAMEDYGTLQSTGLIPPRKAAVFKWNYVGNNAGDFSGFEEGSPYIFENSVQAGKIFVDSGQIYTLTVSGENRTILRQHERRYNIFQTLWEEPGNLVPNIGGVNKYYGHILWAGNDGTICTYGSNGTGQPPVFNKIGFCTGAGAVGNDISGNLIISENSTGTYHLKTLYGYYTSPNVTLLVKELPKLCNITGVTLFYQPISDTDVNQTLTTLVYKNLSTTTSATLIMNHNTDGARGWKYFPLSLTNVNAIRLYLAWSLTGSSSSFNIYRIQIDGYVTNKLV